MTFAHRLAYVEWFVVAVSTLQRFSLYSFPSYRCLTNSFNLVPTLVRSYCCCLLSYVSIILSLR